MTWDAGERGADEYRIYQIYSDGSDSHWSGTDLDGTESTYEVTGLKPDTSYTYAIKAYKEKKERKGMQSPENLFSVRSLSLRHFRRRWELSQSLIRKTQV
ncbi:MAG: fibronectin type III domain-containing protein [Anaerobutyricum soehngenii]